MHEVGERRHLLQWAPPPHSLPRAGARASANCTLPVHVRWVACVLLSVLCVSVHGVGVCSWCCVLCCGVFGTRLWCSGLAAAGCSPPPRHSSTCFAAVTKYTCRAVSDVRRRRRPTDGRTCRNHKWEKSVNAFVDPDTCCGVLPAVGRATASASTLRQRSRAVGTTWRVAAARAVRVLTTCRTRRGPTCGARPKRDGLAVLGRKRGRDASGRVGPRVDLAHLSASEYLASVRGCVLCLLC